jgi:peroxiredoxin Q/BCP
MTKELSAGDRAPDFNLERDGGGRVSLAALKSRKVVLYFYPKDDTSGCTKEAIGFTAALGEFEKAGAVVVGASKDNVARHDKFKAKYDLGVMLASDPDGTLCQDYGVWVEKSMYGRKYMGIERATYLIDGAGVIRRVWRKVKVPGHVDEVLAAAREL